MGLLPILDVYKRQSYDYVHGKNMERPELLEGMNLTTANYGVGLSLAYDSRDVLTNPHKG